MNFYNLILANIFLIAICQAPHCYMSSPSLLYVKPLTAIRQAPHYYMSSPSLLYVKPLTAICQAPHCYTSSPSLLYVKPLTAIRQAPHCYTSSPSLLYVFIKYSVVLWFCYVLIIRFGKLVTISFKKNHLLHIIKYNCACFFLLPVSPRSTWG